MFQGENNRIGKCFVKGITDNLSAIQSSMIDFSLLRIWSCYAISKWHKFFTFDLKFSSYSHNDIYKVHVKGSVSRINILTESIYGKSSIKPVRGCCDVLFFKSRVRGVVRREGGLFN